MSLNRVLPPYHVFWKVFIEGCLSYVIFYFLVPDVELAMFVVSEEFYKGLLNLCFARFVVCLCCETHFVPTQLLESQNVSQVTPWRLSTSCSLTGVKQLKLKLWSQICGAFELLRVRAVPYFKTEFIFIFKFCVYVKVYTHMYSTCRGKKEGVWPLVVGVTVGCEVLVVGAADWTLERQQVSTITELSLQLPGTTFSKE